MRNKYLNKFFGDAKTTGMMIFTILTALFWTTVVYMVLRIWIAGSLGLYLAQHNMYPEALMMVLQSNLFSRILVWTITVIFFLKLIGFTLRKEKTKEPLYVEIVNQKPQEVKQIETPVIKVEQPVEEIEKPLEDRVDISKVQAIIEAEKERKLEPQTHVEAYVPKEVNDGEGKSIPEARPELY